MVLGFIILVLVGNAVFMFGEGASSFWNEDSTYDGSSDYSSSYEVTGCSSDNESESNVDMAYNEFIRRDKNYQSAKKTYLRENDIEKRVNFFENLQNSFGHLIDSYNEMVDIYNEDPYYFENCYDFPSEYIDSKLKYLDEEELSMDAKFERLESEAKKIGIYYT